MWDVEAGLLQKGVETGIKQKLTKIGREDFWVLIEGLRLKCVKVWD